MKPKQSLKHSSASSQINSKADEVRVGTARKEPPYNQLAVIAFVLTFFIPLAGIVLAIIALNEVNKTGEKGKGLAIASIVINAVLALLMILGILALLVFNNFYNLEIRTRDAERRNDINTLHGWLEDYHTQKGIYPTAAEFESRAWMRSETPGAGTFYDAFTPPAPGEEYQYDVSSANCTDQGCDSYILYTRLETHQRPRIYSKYSLNSVPTNQIK